MYQIFLLFIIFTFQPCTEAAAAMTVEEAGKALSSENKQIQLNAETFLKTKQSDAIPTLSQLMFSENKVLRKKALHIWQWIMFGVTDELPEDIRHQLLTFSSRGVARQRRILESIQSNHCLPPMTAACLYSRVLELPYDRRTLYPLTKAANIILNSSLVNHKLSINAYDCRLLRVETCAIIINQLKTDAPEKTQLVQAYPAWLAEHKDLRFLLNKSAVELEINRICQSKRYQEAFSLIIGIQDSKAREVIIEALKIWHQNECDFHLAQLNVDETAGYLVFDEMVCGNNPYDTYLKLRKKHSMLSARTSPQHTVLEVRRLLDEGQFYLAFDYITHKLSPNIDGSLELDPASLRLLGKWAAANMDALTHGLPKVEKRFYRNLLPFIGSLAPMYNLEQPELAKKSAQILNTLELRTPAEHSWIPVLRDDSYRDQFNYQMGIRGRLHDAIEQFRHEKFGLSNIGSIGNLLAIQPEWAGQIRPNELSVDELQEILYAMSSTLYFNYNNLLNANKLASIWEKTHPELLTKFKPNVELNSIQALRSWNAGEKQQAIDKFGLRDTFNYYPRAFYMATMLKAEQNFNIQEHFSKKEISPEFIKELINYILGDENLNFKQIKYGVGLLSILANRPDH